MKKSKVLMFVNFVIIVISVFIIFYAVDVTKYLISIVQYEDLSIGEMVSCYSSIITYLFEVGILAILCRMYKKQLSKDRESVEAAKPEPCTFVWKEQNTDVAELEKTLNRIEQKIDKKSVENVVDASKVKTSTSKKNVNKLSKEEEEKIQKELSKALDRYNNSKKDEDLEKELSKAIANFNKKDPKVPTTKMTKDELLKCAAWNDVTATEDMTKAEIMDAINKKIKPKSKKK